MASSPEHIGSARTRYRSCSTDSLAHSSESEETNVPRDDNAVVASRAEDPTRGDEDRRACDAAGAGVLWGGACGTARTHELASSVVEGFWQHTGHRKDGADCERGKEEREELEHCVTADGRGAESRRGNLYNLENKNLTCLKSEPAIRLRQALGY
jgi:hypothetical protein